MRHSCCYLSECEAFGDATPQQETKLPSSLIRPTLVWRMEREGTERLFSDVQFNESADKVAKVADTFFVTA